jgi:hypothetical protein
MKPTTFLDTEKLIYVAAVNNAEWCHIVCQANGANGQFNDQVWHSTHKVPDYYPNIITLSAACSLETVQAITQKIAGKVAIKDSFNTLPFAPLGFKKLFDAQWLLGPTTNNRKLDYQLVNDINQLKQWETAWDGALSNSPFGYSVRKHPSILFVAIYQDNQILAGSIINKSAGAVGLTNVFWPVDDPAPYWLTCLAAAETFGAGLPVLSYVNNTSLELAKSIGFRELGPLSVWVRE